MSLEKGNKQDYRDTLLLPKTDLPMRANLPDKEPLFCMMVLPMQTEIYIWVPL
jgi:isoleucyl-tRNA synthetase